MTLDEFKALKVGQKIVHAKSGHVYTITRTMEGPNANAHEAECMAKFLIHQDRANEYGMEQ